MPSEIGIAVNSIGSCSGHIRIKLKAFASMMKMGTFTVGVAEIFDFFKFSVAFIVEAVAHVVIAFFQEPTGSFGGRVKVVVMVVRRGWF
jgi:hypothetical protein